MERLAVTLRSVYKYTDEPLQSYQRPSRAYGHMTQPHGDIAGKRATSLTPYVRGRGTSGLPVYKYTVKRYK